MKQSIIIPYHKDQEMIRYNVKTLIATISSEVEIIIVGNNYNTRELEIDFPYENCKYFTVNENLYYPKAINYGVARSSGDILTFYDPDVLALPNWYEPLLNYINNPSVGAVSSKLINPCTGRIIDFGMYYSKFNASHSLIGVKPEHPLAQYDRKVQSACSAVLMTRRDLFDAVGGLNNDLPYAYTDMDYCLKLQDIGYETWVAADSEVYHKGNSDHSNSKSYAFTYLNADSKGMFYADNYNRFKIDFGQWFQTSWADFRNRFPDYPFKYMLLDFSTIYNRQDYYQVMAELGIIIMDKQVITITSRDCSNIYLHQTVPFELIELRTPILYFVDLFTALSDNALWFRNRDISQDIVLDRHGNIYPLLELSRGNC